MISNFGKSLKVVNPLPFANAPGILLKNVSFDFSGVTLFSSLNFEIKGGQWTCLLGPSGCGKSTMLRLISGSLRQGFSGEVRFDGITQTKGQTAWMAQKDLLLPWLTVLNNVLLGARLRGEVSEQQIETANALLDAVGLRHCAFDLPATLSGGMRQRVALLRDLLNHRPAEVELPSLIMLGEQVEPPAQPCDRVSAVVLTEFKHHRRRGETGLSAHVML